MSLRQNDFPLESVAREALFERLARGHREKLAVLTPNRRLSQSLQAEFARWQCARGIAAWESADVLPFSTFVERSWDDALHGEGGASLPLLASPVQQQALWEAAVDTRASSGLLSPSAAAAQCGEAWSLLHAWRLEERFGAQAAGDDANAFLEWSRRYARSLRDHGLTDHAQLPDHVIPRLSQAALPKPSVVALYGFDIVTPQMRDLLEALRARGCALHQVVVAPIAAQARRVELLEAREEVEAAARWARARLEQGARRIGVVVPDLAARRSQVHRAFAAVMRPDHLVARDAAALPFDISLGKPLAEFPLVADALRVLGLAGPESAFEDASRVMRSAFLAAADSELGARSRLDARLRERAPPSLDLDALVRHCNSGSAPRAPLLVERLQRLATFRKTDLFAARLPSQWARSFSDALRVMGFPGERTLDSAEYQALEKWHELLAQLAGLDRVSGNVGFVAILQRLVAMAREVVFQPESRGVPIQVMGILESAGQQFDHLWVMGLTDAAWPLPARPAPFIPAALQRAAGIPQSDPGSSLQLDLRITRGWMQAAREVVVSSARMEKESELAPSPLVAFLPAASLEQLAIPACATLRDAMRRHAALQSIDDARAPAVEAGSHAGGTRLFKDQAACPFRAVARHRLHSRPLETPRPGLDARDRGTLVHEMMHAVWKSLGSRERLVALDARALTTLLQGCADEAIARVKRFRGAALEGRFGELERARLVRVARDWLDVERRRGDFEVIAAEEKHARTFGGITVNVKLDRLDRIEGGVAVIDYKTGVCKTADWMGERPEEPQVPMYAVAMGGEVAAVAFGVVKTGEHRFRGVARAGEPIPKVCTIDKDRTGRKLYRDWSQLVEGWRVSLEALGEGYRRGDARVDPKNGPVTCESCDQHAFCRVAEKAPLATLRASEAQADE